MKKTFFADGLGMVTYTESAWSGKKQLFVDCRELAKINKNTFTLYGKMIEVLGSYAFGARLRYDGREQVITPKPCMYDYILALLPFIFVLIWGNSVTLCSIFPIIGGAIGGAVGGSVAILQIILLKNISSLVKKVLISLAIFIGTVLLLFLMAIVFLLLI